MNQENMNVPNEFKGFSLFNDIEDVALRIRNRAVTLANIAEMHINGSKKISAKGAAIILQYFDLIPPVERGVLRERFIKVMQERGYAAA